MFLWQTSCQLVSFIPNIAVCIYKVTNKGFIFVGIWWVLCIDQFRFLLLIIYLSTFSLCRNARVKCLDTKQAWLNTFCHFVVQSWYKWFILLDLSEKVRNVYYANAVTARIMYYRALSQYKDGLPSYGDFHDIYNGNPYTVKTMFLYWDTPLVFVWMIDLTKNP